MEEISIKKTQNTSPNNIKVVKVKTETNNLGVLKFIVLFLLMLVQISITFLAYLYFISFFRWYSLVALVLTLISCVHILSTPKNNYSKPIWIMFLIIFYSFGYIIYLFSDPRIFWFKSNRRYSKILKNSYQYQKEYKHLCSDEKIVSNCNYLNTAGNFISYKNTDTKYFSSGASLYDSILESLKKAEKFIFIEYFIISDGVLLCRMLNILEEKAKNGVDVRIIYDDFGCYKTLKRKTKKRMLKAGIKLYSFNKITPFLSVLLNYRDHRKMIIIDGKVAYTGGANLADEYINEKRIHGYWKDCGIMIEGEAVDGFTLIYLRQYEFVSKQKQNYSKYLNLADSKNNDSVIVPFSDGLEFNENIGKNAFINVISHATKKLYIMTPYFIPDDAVLNLLRNKAQSGVDVRIILPDIADKKFVYIVSRSKAEQLIDCGVKLYVLKNAFVHSKIILSENDGIIGTINMDLRSFFQQFENAVYLNDFKTLKQINEDFAKTFNNSIEITKQNRKRNRVSNRIISGMLKIISPFM